MFNIRDLCNLCVIPTKELESFTKDLRSACFALNRDDRKSKCYISPNIVSVIFCLFMLSTASANHGLDHRLDHGLDPSLLLGKWVEENNIVTSHEDSEYSEKILICNKVKKEIICEGTSLYKAADQPMAATNTGQILGKVQVSQGIKLNSPLKEDHFFIKNQDSENEYDAIAIKLINNNKIQVLQYQDASLGGLNVIFDGIYLKQKPNS